MGGCTVSKPVAPPVVKEKEEEKGKVGKPAAHSMEIELPKFAVLKSNVSRHYVSYVTEPNDLQGYVCNLEENVFSPLAKIEIEKAKIDGKYIHLRFCNSNRYWGRHSSASGDNYICGISNKPEEDTSKWSCTLFKPTLSPLNDLINLIHVQSGYLVGSFGMKGMDACRLAIDDIHTDNSAYGFHGFTFLDWETLVIMPKYVTFKGYNDKYLKSGWIEGHEYLKFSSDDGNEEAAAYEVTMIPDGHLRIKSNYFDKFWRRSPNWIWADSNDVGEDIDTLFWPVKVDNSTIALRNAGNNRFCSSLTTEGKKDCLNAAVSSISKEARLKVEELVFERSLVDVVYNMEDAQIFDEQPIIAGRGSAENESTEESTMGIVVSYEENSSHSFTGGFSITAGVKTEFKSGVLPFIAEGKIEFSFGVRSNFEWNNTFSETKKSETTYTIKVPPRSRARVHYMATRGNCSVPFTYTQKDKLSNDGRILTSRRNYGVYNGSNFYSFRFRQLPFEPL